MAIKEEPQVLHTPIETEKTLSEVLWWQVDSLKSALSFMRDFALCYDDRSERDKRVKNRTWKDIYNTFFTLLNVNPKDSAGKEWSLKTVKTACDMIHGEKLQDFLTAVDYTSLKDESNKKVHEFLKELETAFIKQWYIKKAS